MKSSGRVERLTVGPSPRGESTTRSAPTALRSLEGLIPQARSATASFAAMNPVAAEPRECAAAPAGAPSRPVVDTANSLLRGPGSDGHHNRVTRSGEVSELIQFGNIVPTGLETSGNTIYMARGTSRGWSGWVGCLG